MRAKSKRLQQVGAGSRLFGGELSCWCVSCSAKLLLFWLHGLIEKDSGCQEASCHRCCKLPGNAGKTDERNKVAILSALQFGRKCYRAEHDTPRKKYVFNQRDDQTVAVLYLQLI